MSVETSQLKCKEKRGWEKQKNIFRNYGTISKGGAFIIGIPVGEERDKCAEEIVKMITSENIPKLMAEPQTTDPKISENTELDKCQKNIYT